MTTQPISILRRRAARRGSALLMVFWFIAMLGMIIYSTHRIVVFDLELTVAQKQAFRARQLAEMGINWAMNPAVKEYDRDILNQVLSEDERFEVRILSEGGRMNINALIQAGEASRTFVTKLFTLWGLSNDEADILFDRMVDWTDADSTKTLHGLEKEDYIAMKGENTPYPFNRPFYLLDEMKLVEGFDQVIANLPGWRDYFTIYSSGRTIDANEAEAKVLAAAALALDGTSDPARDFPEKLKIAERIVIERWGPDGEEDTEDDEQVKAKSTEELKVMLAELTDTANPEFANVFGVGDQTVHIRCVATVGEYRKRVILIVRGRTGTPQILSREEVPLFE